MKLRKNLTQQQTSEYKHPWYESVEQMEQHNSIQQQIADERKRLGWSAEDKIREDRAAKGVAKKLEEISNSEESTKVA